QVVGIDLRGRAQVTDTDLNRLKALPKLARLRLDGTRVTAGAAAELRKALPGCEVMGPAAPADTLRREDIAPYELAAAGDGDPKKALPELVAVLGDSRRKQWGQLMSVALSRDGKLLASAGYDCAVRLWDPVTGKALRTCLCDGWLHCVA